MTKVSKAEAETILRYDQEERKLWLYTAHKGDADRWRKLRYPVVEDGHGWRAIVPLGVLKLKPLNEDGTVKRRRVPAGVGFQRLQPQSDDLTRPK